MQPSLRSPRLMALWKLRQGVHTFFFIPLVSRWVNNSTCSGVFQATIGFSAAHFQPPRAACFLMKMTEKFFFRKYSIDVSIKASLSEEVGLGAHGNVIVVSRSKCGEWVERHFIWCHPATRPWGEDVTQQCPACCRLRSWKRPTVVGGTITLNCTGCRYQATYTKPQDLLLDGAMGKCGGGEWFFTRRVLWKSLYFPFYDTVYRHELAHHWDFTDQYGRSLKSHLIYAMKFSWQVTVYISVIVQIFKNFSQAHQELWW